jgi:hypothetical protein
MAESAAMKVCVCERARARFRARGGGQILRLAVVHGRSDVGVLAVVLCLEVRVEDLDGALIDLLVLVALQRLDFAQPVRLLDEVRIPAAKILIMPRTTIASTRKTRCGH